MLRNHEPSISQELINGATRQTLAGARVFLAGRAPGARELTVVTRNDGPFEFDAAAGAYALSAETPVFTRQGFGGRAAPVAFGVGLVDGTGKPTEDLELVLFPPAVIRGKVIDSAGDPVESGLVQLLRKTTLQGVARTVTARWDRTNDRGEFRFGMLPASNYYIAVTAQPWYPRGILRGNAIIPRLSGHVTMESRAALPLGLTVRLLNLNNLKGTARKVGADGAFNIPNVYPGSYPVSLGGAASIYVKSAVHGSRDSRVINVTDGEVASLQIVAASGLGKVGGTAFRDGKQFYGAMVIAVPEGLPDEPDRYLAYETDSDGSFAFEGIRPGKYRLFAVQNTNLEYASPDAVRPYLKAPVSCKSRRMTRFAKSWKFSTRRSLPPRPNRARSQTLPRR